MNKMSIPLLLLFITVLSSNYAMEWDKVQQAEQLVEKAEEVLQNKQRDLREKVFTKEGKNSFIITKNNEALNFAHQAQLLVEDIKEDEQVTPEIIKETQRTLNRISVIEQKINRK